MIYYILPTFAFMLHLCKIGKVRPIAAVRLAVVLLFFLILLIGMFRGEGIGTDYFSYFYIFRDGTDIEIGFITLIAFLKNLGINFQGFIAFIFLSSFLLKFFVINKLSVNPYLSLMIYLGFWFLVYDMNGIRQGISLSLIVLAVYNVTTGRTFYYWLWCIIAVLLHYSAVVFLPFIFLLNWDCSKKTALTLVAVFLVIAIIGVDFINLALNILGYNDIVARGIKYGMDESFNKNILFSFSTVHRLFICLILFWFVPKMEIDDRLKRIFLWAAVINICTYLLFSSVEIIATRISLYYRFVECLSLAYIPTVFHKESNQILASSFLFLYVLSQVYSTLAIPDNNLEPYYFCF